jgi:hypothetical protein
VRSGIGVLCARKKLPINYDDGTLKNEKPS